ncbi:hypothetical protein C8035_v006671 [Colletotrichum spinosum]|uniref:Uncharacterized protein n=1 Tax=Colletotrichum spinosum TaxID=1347390 RepID=A0A4R8PUH3_9PEZI|nr:hypothetical protein C8035_v006671 [Colletotrichum spinosum]
MCSVENVHFTECGCWRGYHMVLPCHHYNNLISCANIRAAGIHRQPGRCIACRRKEMQKRVYSLSNPRCMTDELVLLREVLNRAVEGSHQRSQEAIQRQATARNAVMASVDETQEITETNDYQTQETATDDSEGD